MKKKFLSMLVVCCLVFCAFAQGQVSAASSDEKDYTIGDDYTEATFLSGYGDAKLLLKKGFDFVNKGSSTINWDLALTGATLSGQVYNDNGAEDLLKDLGYDEVYTTKPMGSDANVAFHPVSSMGYKSLTDSQGNKKNIFAIVVRGTSNLSHDWITDLYDGAWTMFDVSRGQVVDDIKSFLQNNTGKTVDALKQEDNYFFITGHSLGGAVANALSVDETITSLCKGDKEHIYTYTLESPHTCINLWWEDVEGKSNAFNFKDVDDAITNVAPYAGATTYGKDKSFSVNDLDNNVFETVFPDARGGSVTEAPKEENFGDVFGHHDRGLDLVYIIQHGVADGWWQQLYQFDGINSMWPEKDVKEPIPTQEDTSSNWSSLYYDYIMKNKNAIPNGNGEFELVDLSELALHDFDLDGVPELVIGDIGGARMLLAYFTIIDGEVTYAGGAAGKGTFYSDDKAHHGLFREDTIKSGEEGGVNYSELSNGKINGIDVCSFKYNMDSKKYEYTINDKTLYEVYLDCTTELGDNGSRSANHMLESYKWKEIQSNGWKSFLNFYGYHGEQKQSEQQNQNERVNFTLGGKEISIELPSNWNAKTTKSNTGEDITFTVTETNGRDYTVCALRCMTATEYERVKEWYKSLGSSLEESAEYYGNKGDYYYAMVWLDGYGYDPSTQLIIDNALHISHDVAKTFQFCD